MRMHCPNCGEKDRVEITDKGLKKLIRRILSDNRYWCRACNVTWRKKHPAYWMPMRRWYQA
jgi:hypothetical protein